ncbi:hypothetical protein [Clostridium sp.]|uniref:hypothetical protein n=1 Tax=Clostridium sp. TaxID=1506 RepID=UPI001A3BB077|nr:hypothetical protein [Clostridium sp.]MBK5234901.1 hypothetical protein [Clostridium sp.]
MEEVKENKSVVTSYRLSQDTKDKVQQQLKDLGLTQEQYFNKIVGFMELENMKKNNFLTKDTTVIQSNLDAILNSFISIADSSNNLINNKNVEFEELKIKYKDMLSEKESYIMEQKQELQENYSNLLLCQTENEESKKKVLNIRIEYNKQLEQLIGNLKDKNLIVEEYKGKNDMLLSDLKDYKQYKIQVEEDTKLISDKQAQNTEMNNIIKDNNYNINNLNKSIEKSKQDNQKELESLKKENQLNIKLAVAEVKEEMNNKFSQDQFNHNKEIKEYQSKYKSLLEELEKVKPSPKTNRSTIVKNKKASSEGI